VSDPFQPNNLAGPELAADPYAANALASNGYGAPDMRAEKPNALAGVDTAYRHANSYLGILDYLLGRMPSTAVGLVNAAIPYQPLGGIQEAHQASERALDEFRSLYPNASKAILELTSNPMGPGGLSQGILIGGIGARNLDRAGRRTGQQALDLAARMEAQGASPAEIRAATNRLIESGDPLLGGVSKGRDEMRKLELSDQGLQARLGTGYDRVSHPEFEAAYPGTRIFATVEEAAEPFGLIKRREGNEFHMEVRGPTDAARREVTAHEFSHLPQILEPGFAQGADARPLGPSVGPNGLRAGQVVQLGGEEPAYLQEARRIFEREPLGPRRDAMARALPLLAREYETARAQDLYDRLAGETEARSAMARLNLTPAERRARLPELDEDVPRSMQIPWKE
jgi:hypothetical protein